MDKTLLEKLGGSVTIDAVVDKFYDKVLADDRLQHFFGNVDMEKQRAHQKQFLAHAFFGLDADKGLSKYDKVSLRVAHAKLVLDMGLNDTHFDAFLEHFQKTLQELSLPNDLIQELMLVVESIRDDVLNRPTYTTDTGTHQQINSLISHLECLLDMSAYRPESYVQTTSTRIDALLSHILDYVKRIEESYNREKSEK